MAEQPAIKTFSFGGCDFGRTSPGLKEESPHLGVCQSLDTVVAHGRIGDDSTRGVEVVVVHAQEETVA